MTQIMNENMAINGFLNKNICKCICKCKKHFTEAFLYGHSYEGFQLDWLCTLLVLQVSATWGRMSGLSFRRVLCSGYARRFLIWLDCT